MRGFSVNVGELRRVLSEETKEYKPVVFGSEETAKINKDAYNDIRKETENYNGGLTYTKKTPGGGIGASDNKGMSDLMYDNINKSYMDKVESQTKGYVSKDAEEQHKNDEFGNAFYDNEGKTFQAAKKHAKMVKAGKDAAVEMGLTGRMLNKDDVEKNRSAIGESKKIKMLSFNKTKFISEGHVSSMIPDEFKVDGSRFIMRDSVNNQYLVEWSDGSPTLTKKTNMDVVNEQKDRIRELWGYSSPQSFRSNPEMRMNEENGFSDMVNKARKLMKG